jgi:nicotinamide-nucleotide amidase
MKSYTQIIFDIQNGVKQYIIENNIKALIIGVSGGFDSGLGCALLAPICKELGIPLIGRYIHIESNKEEEMERAKLIGDAFCTNFKKKDLTEPFKLLVEHTDETTMFGEVKWDEQSYDDKVRRGNIKSRLRMIYLYNIAKKTKGIVVGCDNKTENSLGFFTIGDSGDINPFISMYKTDLYKLAIHYLRNELSEENEKIALRSVIEATPTDGLGITSSDAEHFGVKSYDELDDILKHLEKFEVCENCIKEFYPIICEKYSKNVVDNIFKIHYNTEYKRKYPYKIELKLEED